MSHRPHLSQACTLACVATIALIVGCQEQTETRRATVQVSNSASVIGQVSFEQDQGEADSVEQADSTAPLRPSEKMPCDGWETPDFVLFCTGRQHGYIEPCGCTGLENAKGGLSRKMWFLTSLKDRGWNVIPVDVGNQVRRLGVQPEAKLQTTTNLLEEMDYAAVGLGPDDLRLSFGELAAALAGDAKFTCANVNVIDLYPRYRIAEAGGRKIGVVSILGSEMQKKINSTDIEFKPAEEALREVLPQIKAEGADFFILLAHTDNEDTKRIAKAFPEFNVIVTAAGAGEPTLEPEQVDGSKAQIIQVGTKGMYVGVVGFYSKPERGIRYERVELDARFGDSKLVLDNFALYQRILEERGLDGLGLKPVKHPSGRKFVGSEVCGDCHTTAYEIFKETPHFHATDSIANPTERSAIVRHFDPECLSCHVTGWNPQGFFPYESGYVDLKESKHLHGNGCENCHGPGSRHADAENGDIDVSDEELESLRDEMKLTLKEARESKCYECHDVDNSPEFDFDGSETGRSYWDEVKHYGKD